MKLLVIIFKYILFSNYSELSDQKKKKKQKKRFQMRKKNVRERLP